jgi:hypothetical protein
MEENELTKVVDTIGLENQTSKYIKEQFLPFFDKAEKWKVKAETLIVTSADQKEEMKLAREARIALKNIRVDANKKRKELKEESLRYGRAVQGVYNVIEYLITPIEEHLSKQENFVKIQEAKRKDELEENRKAELIPYEEFILSYVDLREMSEEDYQKLLNGVKLQLKDKKDQEAQAEKDRIERERKEAEERARIIEENKRLKAEAEKREAEAEKLRIEQKKEREKLAREKADLEAKIRAEEERKQKSEAEAKELIRKANAAPDKEKLRRFASDLNAVNIKLSELTGFVLSEIRNI